MTHFNYFKIFAFILIAALGSCQKDAGIEIVKSFDGVEAELWEHFDNFEKEAAKRGVHVDLTAAGITGTIEKINTPGMVGICNHRVDQPNHVIIDIDFWMTASESAKEMIIFHELGHCYLKRGHNDKAHTDGTCSSIMRSGKGGCIDFYTNSKRGGYLNELYDGAHEH